MDYKNKNVIIYTDLFNVLKEIQYICSTNSIIQQIYENITRNKKFIPTSSHTKIQENEIVNQNLRKQVEDNVKSPMRHKKSKKTEAQHEKKKQDKIK